MMFPEGPVSESSLGSRIRKMNEHDDYHFADDVADDETNLTSMSYICSIILI